MLIDLITLARRRYSEKHPDRDTRELSAEQLFSDFAAVVESEFDRLRKQIERLEAKLTAKDPE
jgi:hypothetical protein